MKKAIEALLETYGSAMQRQRGAESVNFWGFLQPVRVTALSEVREGDFLLLQGRKFRVCRCQGYFEKDTMVCRQGVCMEVGA